MPSLKTILVVDDNPVNRTILTKIISQEYAVLQAENGKAALELLNEHTERIAAVMLDLVMPIMDGFAVLEALLSDGRFGNLPIIVTTGSSDDDNEIKALRLGAWDFVSKPYNPEIISFRLKNAIDRSQLSALKQLQYLAQYDALTGIFNKAKFFKVTRDMIDASPQESFVFIRFDVDRFQLINSFFGAVEGDKLLIYIAEHLVEDAAGFGNASYGRIESDVFGFCLPYDPRTTEFMIEHSKKMLENYNPNYDIVPSVGIYIIDDNSISVEEMYNRATLAAKTCKGNYLDYFAYYNEGMSRALTAEQEITNDMSFALENGQFEIYLQPQYNIHTNRPLGAEALVRWRHPQKGLLLPGRFIPVFERNGFITKLDYYVWEQACKCLHTWIEQGKEPTPISVNVSRVNLYNPKLAETLLSLVRRYELEPALLNLEVTESAYTDNPTALKKVVSQLQSQGFIIMMDDFGSGYSSLSLLKDVVIDILKIDMRFLSETEIPGRGENITASVIRMAKWLNIPVIAEGAETAEQVDFLRSVGCDYVQGFYFARPMPVSEYEELCINNSADAQGFGNKNSNYRYDDLFSIKKDMSLLFNNSLQAAVIYEFVDDRIEMIRVNEAYYALLGHDDMLAKAPCLLNVVEEPFRAPLLGAFRACVKERGSSECEYMRRRSGGAPVWIYTKLSYVSSAGKKHILIGELSDITLRKEIDSELQKYRASLLAGDHNAHTVLIVDDAPVNRELLKSILQESFNFLEAENGEEAIKVLREHPQQIDLILLDIVMPVMDGKTFLQYKKQTPELDGIPVIVITADNSREQQISTIALGANDYIVKPFIPEVVIRRVYNVLESNHRFKEMVREYNSMSEQVKTDLMTGLFNRASVEEIITKRLESANGSCAMLMLDIDNFKKFNDTCGHAYGDKVVAEVAEKLRASFRQDDILARMGGDEFAIFLCNVSQGAAVEQKARKLCKSISDIIIDGKNAEITCSVGIAMTSEKVNTFEQLYKNADIALYNTKFRGRNAVSVFGEEAKTSIIRWMNDAESVLEEINDSLYICDKDSYEMIYANEKLCNLVGVSQEECKGRKCYEVLQHKDAPCSFCSIPIISEDRVYSRLYSPENSPSSFLLRGKNINMNGIIAHVEVLVDVSKIENSDEFLKEMKNRGEK
ncbi:MAG: EAL domain-containing protein [Oscillospiraceae bacterium]